MSIVTVPIVLRYTNKESGASKIVCDDLQMLDFGPLAFMPQYLEKRAQSLLLMFVKGNMCRSGYYSYMFPYGTSEFVYGMNI